MTVLCVDLGGSSAKLGLLDRGRVIAVAKHVVSGSSGDLEFIRDQADALRAGHSDAGPVSAVALAVPGTIDPLRGTLVKAHDKYSYAIGMDLRRWATEAFGLPAVIENDARAALLGETTFGVAKRATNAVLVTLGTGIGTAAMIDGRLLHGVHDHAGILGGHFTVDLDGPVCSCGNVGCAEALASTWALPRAIRAHPLFAHSDVWRERLDSSAIGIKELVENASDPLARDVLARLLRVWGAATVSLCHAYDPSVVVLTGGALRAGELVLGPISEYVNSHLWSSFPRPRILCSHHPEQSVLLGLDALAESASPELADRVGP